MATLKPGQSLVRETRIDDNAESNSINVKNYSLPQQQKFCKTGKTRVGGVCIFVNKKYNAEFCIENNPLAQICEFCL